MGDRHQLHPHETGIYLIIDWFSRRVLAWRLSITLEVDFCIAALKEALFGYGRPEIFNTDQPFMTCEHAAAGQWGNQFTTFKFTDVLKEAGIKISMDGKGTWRDNVFVERLWRTIKYEEVYLHAYENVPQARAAIGKYLKFYNEKRSHSSLDRKTPDQVYFNQLQPIPVAA